MSIMKKILLLSIVFGVFLFATSNSFGREVLYGNFDSILPSHPPLSKVTLLIGENLNAVNCNFYNGQVTTGKINGAYLFDGTAYILIPDGDPTLNFGYDDFAISFWVKPYSTKVNNTICDKRDAYGYGYHVTLYYGRPLLQMHDTVYGAANYWGGMSSPHVTDGSWHHVSIYVERDSSTGGKIYIDGLCVHTFNPTNHSGSLNNSANLYIGKHKDNSNYNFEGVLDEYRHFRYIPK